MTTLHQLRKAALALPETEQSEDGSVAFAVAGKEFAALLEDGRVRLRLPPEAVEAALEEHPTAEALSGEQGTAVLRIPIADVNGMVLNALVRAAWKYRAPARLVAALDQADAAEPGEGDLPAGIGRPATRALHGAGLTNLDLVAAKSESELLELHGVGPKAVRILGQALAEQGRSLRH